MAKDKEVKYEDLCTPSKVRDPNTGKLVNSEAEFEKIVNSETEFEKPKVPVKPEEKTK